jgi:hypothetical protein
VKEEDMANPIIIDDGGSTRIIKKLNEDGRGAMNTLFNLHEGVNRKGLPSIGSSTVAGTGYMHIRCVSLDQNGECIPLVNGDLVVGDKVKIESGNEQSVSAAIAEDGKLTISIDGPPCNPPVIEAKQVNGKRLYIVSNAGAIEHIEGTVHGTDVAVDVPPDVNYTAIIISGRTAVA